MCENVYARACMNERVWKSEDSLWKLVSPSAMWDLGIKLEVVRFASKCLYLLSYPMSP